MEKLKFLPVDLANDLEKCVEFRADSFVISFGDALKFYEDDGKGAERYVEWLKAKIAKEPQSVVHVFRGDQLVGQLELGRLREDPSRGYVNLYYLSFAFRGKGFGSQLDAHAMTYFRNQNLKSVRLSVSPTNESAVKFYKKMGWRDLGPRPHHPEVHFMEKQV